MEEEAESQARVDTFLQWLQVNGAELRCCDIRSCDSYKGYGVFHSNKGSGQRILFVVPLDLAITPMRVLQDPILGPKCRALFEEGDVDDRMLLMLFLLVERLRKNSLWKPYLDVLPKTFGNPLWFTDDELSELKGTALHRATTLQKKSLQFLFDDKMKPLALELLNLDGELERMVCFEDFLWANSIFWARALNIPFPHAYVFPPLVEKMENTSFSCSDEPMVQSSGGSLGHGTDRKGGQSIGEETSAFAVNATSKYEDTVWVEGLVPGIDFCNHDRKASTTWEVDGTGSATGVSSSMYLLSSSETSASQAENEICISYGNKGNEELLYLYGFVINDNPDDYLMVHYPMDALQNVPCADSKGMLLELQKAEMRCLLPKSLLDHGFFSATCEKGNQNNWPTGQNCAFSWSGQRKAPSYLNRLVFPADFLTALRTISMQELQLLQVNSMLGDLVGSRDDKQPSDTEVKAAIWEACGDTGALQLLVDLLSMKMIELEEGSGTEASDTELLDNAVVAKFIEHASVIDSSDKELMSRNRWSSIVYRRGQKQLTRLFLKEAEHALQLALSEELGKSI